jgi:hypothetical protein
VKTVRRFLVFGVSAAISMLAGPLGAESVKPADGAKPRQETDSPKPGAASRGASQITPASASTAETVEDAEAGRLRSEDERKATESKEKMKKRPGYKEDVPAPRG